MEGYLFSKIDRPSKKALSEYNSVSVSTAFECNDGQNLLDWGIKPIISNKHIFGPAVTCLAVSGDNLTLHKALSLAQPGDVLIINGGGNIHTALWGGNMTNGAIARGVAGCVIDGAIRDVNEIRKLDFPIWTRNIYPGRPTKKYFGAINIPIECGGVIVSPGDLIIADDDGVISIPSSKISDVLQKSLERIEIEKKIGERLENGETTMEVFKLDQIIEDQNINEVGSSFNAWIKRSKIN